MKTELGEKLYFGEKRKIPSIMKNKKFRFLISCDCLRKQKPIYQKVAFASSPVCHQIKSNHRCCASQGLLLDFECSLIESIPEFIAATVEFYV
jgi:hypothetical protein